MKRQFTVPHLMFRAEPCCNQVWPGTPIVDQHLQKLMKQLGDAINESLSDSEQIAKVISKIKAGGYDVFLVLEATIGFNKQDEAGAGEPIVTREAKSNPELKISQQDVKFLKSLRISVDNQIGDRKDRAA
jgi:hypothetical protein